MIREAGWLTGIVDYKVCAINQIWSGLKFARRKLEQAVDCLRVTVDLISYGSLFVTDRFRSRTSPHVLR